MKKLFVIAIALAGFAFAAAAHADVPATPTSLCQQGAALGPCPNGVPSNVSASVADAYSRYSTNGQSVTGNVANNTSVSAPTSAYGNQSVAAPRNAADSVAWSQARSNDSVASTGGFSSSSVATGAGGSNSMSVVH